MTELRKGDRMFASLRGRLALAAGSCALGAALLGAVAVPAGATVPKAAPLSAPRSAALDAPRSASLTVPPGVTAGVAVFDRQTGTFTEQLNPDMQFRSASVVKLLLALDFLWGKDPSAVSSGDHDRLDSMLRRSDDNAAQYYWDNDGLNQILVRMVPRLGLTDTAPPPSGYPEFWGYVALSPADTVRIYRYILDSAPAWIRDLIMGDLHASETCGKDGFDERFGIPSVFARPWAVKEGWSGFGNTSDCNGGAVTAAAKTGDRPRTASTVDITRPALHSTGTVGAGDRTIVAVFTLQPQNIAFGKAYSNVNSLVRTLNVPGGSPLPGTVIGTWSNGVHIRAAATTASSVLSVLPAGVDTLVSCQKQGQEVSVPPYDNDWWAYLPQYGGYVSNIYMSSPDNQLPGVPLC
jgi:hypothetical protein